MLPWFATITQGRPGAGGSPTVFTGIRRPAQRACTVTHVTRHRQDNFGRTKTSNQHGVPPGP